MDDRLEPIVVEPDASELDSWQSHRRQSVRRVATAATVFVIVAALATAVALHTRKTPSAHRCPGQQLDPALLRLPASELVRRGVADGLPAESGTTRVAVERALATVGDEFRREYPRATRFSVGSFYGLTYRNDASRPSDYRRVHGFAIWIHYRNEADCRGPIGIFGGRDGRVPTVSVFDQTAAR